MALASLPRIENTAGNLQPPIPSASSIPSNPLQQTPALPNSLAHSAFLLDRTRHSMSLTSKPAHSRHSKPRPKSKVYPTNPFEIPDKERVTQSSGVIDRGERVMEDEML